MKDNTNFGCFNDVLKIGVLGGIGPEATAEFYRKLIEKLQKTGIIKTNADFPQVVINSIPAPELIYDDISETEIKPYISGLKELDNFGVDFIVMVCNTIHLYQGCLQKEIKTPIVDLRAEVKKALEAKGIKKALVLGTPAMINHGLYRFGNIDIVEPADEELRRLTDAIFLFNKGVKKNAQCKKVRNVCQKYTISGTNHVILGCTEIALMLEDYKISKINTMNVLIDATCRKILEKRAKHKNNYKSRAPIYH